MTEYSVLFAVKFTAKNVKQLEKKAERTGEKLSQCINKTVLPLSYGVIEKKDQLQTTLTEEDSE